MTEDQRPPLSEEAALRELEELQREIERTRLRRKDANEAFDRFLRSFDRHVPASTIEEPVERRPPMPPPPADFMPPAPRRDPPPLPLPPPAPEAIVAPPPLVVAEPTPELEPERAQEERVESFPPEALLPRNREEALNLDKWEERSEPTVTTSAFPTESEVAARRATFSAPPAETRPVPAALTGAGGRGRRIPPVIGVLGIVVAGAIAFFLWRGSGGNEGTADSVATTAAPAARPQPAPAPASPVAAPAAPQPPPAAEVSTVRRAWVRVVVDGRKVIERELPADSHIPLEAGSQYVVRAGDAGAVRLAIAGKDQGPVGADGQVATKTYTAATKTVR